MGKYFLIIQQLLFIILIIWIKLIKTQDEPSCDSPIYCQGKLLDLIQTAHIFNDSKTFVDMKMIYTSNEILNNFNNFLKETNNKPNNTQIKTFLYKNFEFKNELEDWIPSDYTPCPKLIRKINCKPIKIFAKQLIRLWIALSKKIKIDVLNTSEQYSIIPVKNGFIVSGGRFREFYYWDTYWVMKGLLLSDMPHTVRGMLDNFITFIKLYGFIPNGSRIYYLNRSQPPLLTLMVFDYIQYTNDYIWLKNNIIYLDNELTYWLNNKTININYNNINYTIAYYNTNSGSPRPESYYEDIKTAQNELNKKKLYSNLKSGAESGWDFSTRWFFDKYGNNNGNLTNIDTKRIAPVDLNSFLCQAFNILSNFYNQLNNTNKKIYWEKHANNFQKTIDDIFYDNNDGIWYDFDILLKKSRKYFYASNFSPLWTNSYNKNNSQIIGKKAANYFIKKGLHIYNGGIPSSLEQSGEQWDFPNAWAPSQAIIIYGLKNTNDPNAIQIASQCARNWIQANMIGFANTKQMFEKYDAINPGQHGGGGEYAVQSGFGWTNGVALQLISDFFINNC